MDAAHRTQLARDIYDISHLTGEFILRSRVTSNEYFDKYRFESPPGLLKRIAAGLSELLPSDVDGLAGLELGGVPLATALSIHTGIPAFYVRKEAKTYGTCNLVEGGEFSGKRLVVVEDVITSGGQVIKSTSDLVDRGADIACVLCVVDRESGGAQNIAEAGFELRALFTMSELKAAGERTA